MIQKKPDMLSKDQYLKLPTNEREHYLRNIIKKTIEVNPNGVTQGELSRELGLDIRTVDKYLTMLLHTNMIYLEPYDDTKVYLPNGRAMRPVFEEKLELDGKNYEIFQLRNRRGEFVLIQEKSTGEIRDDVMAGILIPLQKYPDFVEYLKKSMTEMMKRGITQEASK